ncbi:MAG: hypothetical protein OHK0052_25220 [Anaerolineales bacterium]
MQQQDQDRQYILRALVTSAQELWQTSRTFQILVNISILVLISILSIMLYLGGRDSHHLVRYGYPGIFLISLFVNFSLVLPIPGVAFVTAMGAMSQYNPWLVALWAGAGASIGEMSGYVLGLSGQVFINNNRFYTYLFEWMKSHRVAAYIAIYILATIPNPLFDMAGIAAGALKIPWRWFMFWCFLGKTTKMIFFAFAGVFSFHIFSPLKP